PRRRPRPATPDPHDRLRLHPRCFSPRDLERRRRQLATDSGHDRHRGDAGRDAHRRLHHPGHVLRERALPTTVRTRVAAGRGARSDQRRDERRAFNGRQTPMTRSARIVSSIVAVALLGGCAIGPNYKRPAASARNFQSAATAGSWELDIWGRIRRSNEAARATLFATEDARRGVWLTLVSDLAQAYFELLALDVRLQIARNSTDAYQRTYDLFLDRFNLGAASKLETSRAQGALGEAQANIPQLESDIVAKENQISILLGTT